MDTEPSTSEDSSSSSFQIYPNYLSSKIIKTVIFIQRPNRKINFIDPPPPSSSSLSPPSYLPPPAPSSYSPSPSFTAFPSLLPSTPSSLPPPHSSQSSPSPSLLLPPPPSCFPSPSLLISSPSFVLPPSSLNPPPTSPLPLSFPFTDSPPSSLLPSPPPSLSPSSLSSSFPPHPSSQPSSPSPSPSPHSCSKQLSKLEELLISLLLKLPLPNLDEIKTFSLDLLLTLLPHLKTHFRNRSFEAIASAIAILAIKTLNLPLTIKEIISQTSQHKDLTKLINKCVFKIRSLLPEETFQTLPPPSSLSPNILPPTSLSPPTPPSSISPLSFPLSSPSSFPPPSSFQPSSLSPPSSPPSHLSRKSDSELLTRIFASLNLQTDFLFTVSCEVFFLLSQSTDFSARHKNTIAACSIKIVDFVLGQGKLTWESLAEAAKVNKVTIKNLYREVRSSGELAKCLKRRGGREELPDV